MAAEKLVHLNPEKIQTGENIRFGLKDYRVASLAASILSAGQVNTPIEVEKLPQPVNGYTHRLTTGHYRLAAVNKLNADGAGLSIPAIERTPADELDRMKRQVSENMDRENMSPMDRAHAMKAMLDAGATRADVLVAFSTPGGRKGLAIQPLSNSSLNMHLDMLTLPKKIQAAIHDGIVGVSTAYELTKVEPEKRDEVFAKALEARDRRLAREERDEAKAASAETKEAEKAAKEQAKTEKVKAAQKAAEEAIAAKDAAVQAVEDATKAKAEAGMIGKLEAEHGKPYAELPQDVQKRFAENLGAAKANLKAAEKALADAKKKADKAVKAYEALVAPPAPAKEEAAPAKAAKVSPKDVKKAAKEAGAASAKTQRLNIGEAREAAAELAKSKDKKVAGIGVIFGKLLNGDLTTKQAAEAFKLVK